MKNEKLKVGSCEKKRIAQVLLMQGRFTSAAKLAVALGISTTAAHGLIARLIRAKLIRETHPGEIKAVDRDRCEAAAGGQHAQR